jgi:hypothetical protein|tara:strand:- start:3271 stop:3693 length:423 start_codon:yes stop_codon:yes gene_type:complete
MTDKYEKLDETFNVESVEVEVQRNITSSKIEKIKTDSEDIRKDYEYTRGNLYSIIEKGQEAINGILELAQESEMPRAYEVAGQLIKNVADATDKLLTLQQKLKDVEDEKDLKGPTTVNNALFVGSTAELQKLLKKNTNDK